MCVFWEIIVIKNLSLHRLYNILSKMKYDIFISYSRRDTAKVLEFVNFLESNGYSCWIDREGIYTGDVFKSVITDAIHNSKMFLFLSSKDSNKSEWTRKEVSLAVHLKKYIVPIKLDNEPYNKTLLFDLVDLDFIDWSKKDSRLSVQNKLLKTLEKVIGKRTICETDEQEKRKSQSKVRDVVFKMKQMFFKFVKWVLWFLGAFALLGIILVKCINEEHKIQDKSEVNVEIDTTVDVTNISKLNDTIANNENRLLNSFVLVQGGVLNYEEYEYKNEIPIKHNYDVLIDSFYICKYELMQCQYQDVIGDLSPMNYTFECYSGVDWYTHMIEVKGDSIPVLLKYEDVALYCNKCSELLGCKGFYNIGDDGIKLEMEGNGFRLMNEFEYLYVAKGGPNKDKYRYSGSNDLGVVAWYGGNSGYKPHTVGKKQPNSLGIYDLTGNVSEIMETRSKLCNTRVNTGGGYNEYIGFNIGDIWCASDVGCYRIVYVPKDMRNSNHLLTPKFE